MQQGSCRNDFRAELTEIAAPMLPIHGTADASAPIGLTAERTAKLIPDCEFPPSPRGRGAIETIPLH
ncbi:MAG TPA: hypothetical protein VGN05_00010 [Parvibaculum sp.]